MEHPSPIPQKRWGALGLVETNKVAEATTSHHHCPSGASGREADALETRPRGWAERPLQTHGQSSYPRAAVYVLRPLTECGEYYRLCR
eukprot:6260981-Amphidinium_carterae.1